MDQPQVVEFPNQTAVGKVRSEVKNSALLPLNSFNPVFIDRYSPIRAQSANKTKQQIANPQLVSKPHQLSEVQTIIQRVDHAFRQRKDGCFKLACEIADLEAQLEYLKKETAECADIASSQSASLSWTRNNLESLETEFKEFHLNYVEVANDNFGLVQSLDQDAESIVEILQIQLNALYDEKGNVLKVLHNTEHELQEHVDRQAALELRLKEILMDIDDRNHNLFIIKDQLNQVKAEEQELLSTEARLEDALQRTRLECNHHQIVLNDAAKELEALETLCKNQVTLLEQHEEDYLRERSAFDDYVKKVEEKLSRDVEELEILNKNCIQNIDKLDEAKRNLHSLVEANSSLTQKVSMQQEVCSNNDNTINHLSLLVEEVQVKVKDMNHDIFKVKDSIEKISLQNNLQYDYTCAKLKEIKHLHLCDSIARQELLQTEQMITSKVSDLLGKCHMVESEIIKIHVEKEQIIQRLFEIRLEKQKSEEHQEAVAAEFSLQKSQHNDLEGKIQEKLVAKMEAETFYSNCKSVMERAKLVETEIEEKTLVLANIKFRRALVEAERIENELAMQNLTENDMSSEMELTEEELTILDQQIHDEGYLLEESRKQQQEIEEIEAIRMKIREAGRFTAPHISSLENEIANLQRELEKASNSSTLSAYGGRFAGLDMKIDSNRIDHAHSGCFANIKASDVTPPPPSDVHLSPQSEKLRKESSFHQTALDDAISVHTIEDWFNADDF